MGSTIADKELSKHGFRKKIKRFIKDKVVKTLMKVNTSLVRASIMRKKELQAGLKGDLGDSVLRTRKLSKLDLRRKITQFIK